MNIKSKLPITDKIFIISAFLCLLLTTFPLAQGWISRGDFIPRAFFIMLTFILQLRLFLSKDGIFLGCFFLYMLITGDEGITVGFVVNVLEFVIPCVLANYFLASEDDVQSIVGRFAIVISVFIMANTVIVNMAYPGIVRAMVGISAQKDLTLATFFSRLGVCNYSFALISMCLTPVFLYMSSIKKKKLVYLIFSLLTLLFVYISGVTTCLIILVVMLINYFVTRNKTDYKVLSKSFLITTAVLYFGGFVIVDFFLPLLEGTIFYGHFGGLLEFYGKETSVNNVYDVDRRVALYMESLETFLSHPLFGSATGNIGGHNYFLDRLARVGIVGMLPFFIFLYYRFKAAICILSNKSKVVYIICIAGFFMLGFLKNMSGIDYWTYMFLYIPCILKYGELALKKG